MDIETPGGYKPHLHYNTSPADFHRFMLKRDLVENFRLQTEKLVGPSEGPVPLEIDCGVKP